MVWQSWRITCTMPPSFTTESHQRTTTFSAVWSSKKIPMSDASWFALSVHSTLLGRLSPSVRYIIPSHATSLTLSRLSRRPTQLVSCKKTKGWVSRTSASFSPRSAHLFLRKVLKRLKLSKTDSVCAGSMQTLRWRGTKIVWLLRWSASLKVLATDSIG